MSTAKYTSDLLARTAAASASLTDLMRRLNAPMGSAPRGYLLKRLEHYEIDTSHLEPGCARTKTVHLRRALDDLDVPHTCETCGVGDVWQGKRLVLEIDHINGDRLDNRQENLRYLCPSCHSQTKTFANRSHRLPSPRGTVE